MFNGGVKDQIGRSLLLLLLCCGLSEAMVVAPGRATLKGIIYFTNNTPDNLQEFPVELFTRNRKRKLAEARVNDKHRFTFSELEKRKYLLKVTWPERCVLWYRIDLKAKSEVNGRIIMDVDCAHANGKIQDLPEKL